MADEPTEQSRRHRSRDEPTDAARPHRSNRHRQSVQEAESYIERLASEKSLEMHLYPEQHNNTELSAGCAKSKTGRVAAAAGRSRWFVS